jgi:hypothetical protein
VSRTGFGQKTHARFRAGGASPANGAFHFSYFLLNI